MWAVLLAIALPPPALAPDRCPLAVAAAALWGVLAAPRARRRLALRPRIVFELGFFAFAAVALWRAGSATLASVFAALVVANAVLLTVFDQWEA